MKTSKRNNRNHPKRLRRSESFLGMHFDFHAGEGDREIGARTTRRMVEEIIEKVKPDYVQCDCKGHGGYASYPSKIGNAAPGIVKDQLRIWRDVTAEHGVALYMHYSGVVDVLAVKKHPSWVRIDEKGKKDVQATSTFMPYVDRVLIPQIKELNDTYGVDGVWIDGECWGTKPDYRKEALDAFKRETGIDTVPRKPGDPHYSEFMDFCREQFRKYLRHYTDAIHAHNPDFQVCSNWAFTSLMPEPVSAGVDFISGDYVLYASVDSVRREGRCMARQGMPWDLMAWSFNAKVEEGAYSTKTPVQLKREAAIVLSLGGGFQAYFTQKRDGSVSLWQMDCMKEVAEFCRARQKICHKAEAVPQIALLYSKAALYKNETLLFGGWRDEFMLPVQGVLNGLLESQNTVELLMEHQLSGRMREYPLIVIPEWDYLEPALIKELLAYVSSGGNLLVVGPKAAALFKDELGVSFNGGMVDNTARWLEHGGKLAAIKTCMADVTLKKGTAAFGRMYDENDDTGEYHAAASIARHGKGRIAGIYFNYGERYMRARTSVAGEFLNALVRELFPDPIAEVEGSRYVDVTVNRINGMLAVNLVNTAGPHADLNVYTFDDIPPVGPLSISVRYDKKPSKVTLEPGGKKLPYSYEDGKIKVRLERLEIHEVVVIK